MNVEELLTFLKAKFARDYVRYVHKTYEVTEAEFYFGAWLNTIEFAEHLYAQDRWLYSHLWTGLLMSLKQLAHSFKSDPDYKEEWSPYYTLRD